MSCPTSLFCAAVDAAGFAYIYQRGAWSSARKIAGATSILNSVSCPTAAFCMAVAGSTGAAGGSTYLYSHGRWSSGQRFTRDGYGESSVSCPAVSRCVVVGWGGDHHYSNGVWSSQVSFAGPVTSLTCTSVAFCVAVQRDRGNGGIAITYTHGKWSTKNGGVISEPSAVSCASTSFCVALGRNRRVFLLRWHVVRRSTPRIGHHTVLSVVSLAFILHGGWGAPGQQVERSGLWLYVLERLLVDRAKAWQRALFRVLPHLEALHCRRSSGTRPHLLGWSLELVAIAQAVAMPHLEGRSSGLDPNSAPTITISCHRGEKDEEAPAMVTASIPRGGAPARNRSTPPRRWTSRARGSRRG